MITLTDPDDNSTIEVTDNEFRAIFVLMSDCLDNMGGKRPNDIFNDELTWTASEVLVESGKWSHAQARGTYGALEKKGLIYIEGEKDGYNRYEDMVNPFVFSIFDLIWDDRESIEILNDLQN